MRPADVSNRRCLHQRSDSSVFDLLQHGQLLFHAGGCERTARQPNDEVRFVDETHPPHGVVGSRSRQVFVWRARPLRTLGLQERRDDRTARVRFVVVDAFVHDSTIADRGGSPRANDPDASQREATADPAAQPRDADRGGSPRANDPDASQREATADPAAQPRDADRGGSPRANDPDASQREATADQTVESRA